MKLNATNIDVDVLFHVLLLTNISQRRRLKKKMKRKLRSRRRSRKRKKRLKRRSERRKQRRKINILMISKTKSNLLKLKKTIRKRGK